MGRRSSVRSLAVGGLALALTAGCGVLPPPGRTVPRECEFPEGVRLSFAGETTLAELGIPDPGQEPEAVYAWVTAETIRFPSSTREYRAACAERDDGTFVISAYPGSLGLPDD